MVTYFDKLRDAEIGGGDFTNVSGDYVGGDGVRRGADESKERSDPVSYFPNAKGLKITGGNFMSVGGDLYAGRSQSTSTPIPPIFSGLVPIGTQCESYSGDTYPHPSIPQRAMYNETAPPQQGILLAFGLRFLA